MTEWATHVTGKMTRNNGAVPCARCGMVLWVRPKDAHLSQGTPWLHGQEVVSNGRESRAAGGGDTYPACEEWKPQVGDRPVSADLRAERSRATEHPH